MADDLALMPWASTRREDVAVRYSWMTLGLVVYLRDEAAWARTHAARAFALFRQVVDTSGLSWFRSSALGRWEQVGASFGDELAAALAPKGIGRVHPRHQFELRLVDDAGAHRTGFIYRERDLSRGGRPGYVAFHLPANADPRALQWWAEQFADSFPTYGGVGGFMPTSNELHAATSFNSIHQWCRRYLGVIAHSPEEAAWGVVDGLPDIGWLTLLTGPAREEAERRLADHPELAARIVHRGDHGALLRAGERPELGDVNLMSYPRELASLHLELGDLRAPAPRLPGPFAEEAQAEAWWERFRHPEGWG